MNEVKKAAICKFFYNFTEWHRPFIRELAEKYKECGRFPFIPMRDLARFYEDKRDREIAAFAGMLLKNDEKVEQRVREFRLMLGESPWEWFKSRRFALLSTGQNQNKRTGGVQGWRIAHLMDAAYDNAMNRVSFEKIVNLSDTELWKKRLIRVVFGTSDGIGIGGWSVAPKALRCPDTDGVRRFVHLWLPEFRIHGGKDQMFVFDEAVRMYGFDRDCDFFYAYLGWKELCRRNPKGCSRYATVYHKRYSEFNLTSSRYWVGDQGIVPIVKF